MRISSILFALAMSVCAVFGVSAENTNITVRVLANDAKFVGTSMGGAEVTIRDAVTQEVFATGLTSGGTGDTALIMKTPRTRGSSIVSEGSASFAATINLSEPRLVEVLVRGPLVPNASAVTSSSQQWVVPGKHVDDANAWLVELRGLVVEVVDFPSEVNGETVNLHAKVRMMCGCPTSPGGMWNSDQMEIVALLEKDGVTRKVPLIFTGEASHFSATAPVNKGHYNVTFYAYQMDTGNTGVVKRKLTVR
ncbi:MAG: hypothetical protein AB3N28_13280 [Kordiimonas sp.]